MSILNLILLSCSETAIIPFETESPAGSDAEDSGTDEATGDSADPGPGDSDSEVPDDPADSGEHGDSGERSDTGDTGTDETDTGEPATSPAACTTLLTITDTDAVFVGEDYGGVEGVGTSGIIVGNIFVSEDDGVLTSFAQAVEGNPACELELYVMERTSSLDPWAHKYRCVAALGGGVEWVVATDMDLPYFAGREYLLAGAVDCGNPVLFRGAAAPPELAADTPIGSWKSSFRNDTFIPSDTYVPTGSTSATSTDFMATQAVVAE